MPPDPRPTRPSRLTDAWQGLPPPADDPAVTAYADAALDDLIRPKEPTMPDQAADNRTAVQRARFDVPLNPDDPADAPAGVARAHHRLDTELDHLEHLVDENLPDLLRRLDPILTPPEPKAVDPGDAMGAVPTDKDPRRPSALAEVLDDHVTRFRRISRRLEEALADTRGRLDL